MKTDKGRYIKQKHTAVEKSVILVALSLLCLAGIFPIGLVTTPVGGTENPENPTSAWNSLTNTSATGTGARFFVEASANGTQSFTQSAFSGTSSAQNMPVYTGSGWSIDRTMITISGLQDTRNYVSAVGTFVNSGDWSAAPSVWSNWPTASGVQLAVPSRNTDPTYTDGGDAGSAQITVNSRNEQDNLLKFSNFGLASGGNWSAPQAASTDLNTNNLQYYAWANGAAASCGCWNCVCCTHGGGMPSGWQSGYAYATLADDNTNPVVTSTAAPTIWLKSQQSVCGATVGAYRIASDVTGYASAHGSTSDGCSSTAQAGHSFDRDYRRSYYSDAPTYYYYVPTGVMSSVNLQYSFRYYLTGSFPDSNRYFDIAVAFQYFKPGGYPSSPIDIGGETIHYYDSWSGNNNVCQVDKTITMPTGALDQEGTYYVRVIVTIRLRQYNAQGPNTVTGQNPTAVTTLTRFNDAVEVDLWNVKLNYLALTNYPTNSYTYLGTTNNMNLGSRQLFGSDPTLNMKVLVPERSSGTGESYYGAFVSAFIQRNSDGAILVCPGPASTARLSLLTSDGYNTYKTLSIPLTNFITWMGSNTLFKVGVGIFFDTGGFRIGLSGAFSFWIDTIDLSITAHPLASAVGLTYQVYTAGGGYSTPAKAFTDNGYGGGTCVITAAECGGYLPSGNSESIRFGTSSSSVSFSGTFIAYITYADFSTQSASYKGVSSDTVNFYIDTYVTIPKVAGMVDSLNYNSSLQHNLTIPLYTIGANRYWAFDKGKDPQNPGNIITAETDPAAWQRAYQTLIDPNVDPNIYSQKLQFNSASYAPQLINKASVHWQLNFTAPNEIAASTDMKISTRSDFNPESTSFLLGETCYIRATYRTDADTDSNPTNTEAMTAVLLQNTGTMWNSSYGGNNGASGSTIYNANFYIGQGKGEGYTAIVTYNMTNIQASMPGVYRIGYRVKPFAVVRRTQVVGFTCTPPIYDTNQAPMNASPINIYFTWQDSQLLTPIDSSDGVAVSAKITIDYWYAEAGFGYKMHAPENRPTSTAPLGWQDLTLQYNGAGVYACYPLPMSEWRDISGNLGNISQGFKNYTITISKEGYQTQVIKGNFSIIVDAYMMFSTPPHDAYSDFQMGGQTLPHEMSTGASAGDNFSLYTALYERTPDEIDNTVDYTMSDQFNNFYQGKINITYQLYMISDLQGGTQQYGPGMVNWTYVGTTGFNYANGSFATTGGPNYRLQLKLPVYRENGIGFGDTVDGGNEKLLWYNVSFTVKTNTTMVLYDAAHDYYSRDFQPNIVQNRSCENISTPGYNAGVPGPQAVKTGKVNEEVQIIYLHKENTANITVLSLVTTNDTDSGWAYAMKTNQHVVPNVDDPRNPTMGKYQVVNYWKNETEYSSQGLPPVSMPYSGFGVEYLYMNRTDVVRFRVKYNCTYTLMQTQNPYVPPCGPLNKSASLGWDGVAEIKLYGWNSTVLNLTEDTSYLWNWTFTGYPGPQQYNIYGTTWVTPWLNLTQHDAVSYTDEGMMPYIVARKKGFNDGKLILNLTILDQATNMTIDTNTGQVQISRGQTENLANHAVLNIPVGTVRSFNFTYRDVTNAIYQPWASNKTYMISGATISIESTADDPTNSHIYFNNDTFQTWSYYEYPTSPGKYNITIWVPEGRPDMTLTGIAQNTTMALRFKISKQNYQSKYVNVDLNVTRRTLQLNLVWARDVTSYSAWGNGLTSQGIFRWLVLSYEIYDVDYGQYVDLNNYITPDHGDYQAAFSFDSFWTGKVYSAEVATYNGHPVYNITLWPSTTDDILNVLGPHDVKTTVSKYGSSSLQNLKEASSNHTITIIAPTTDFRMLTANDTAIEYFASDLAWDKSFMASYTFQLVDLNTSAVLGYNVTWPAISLDYNCISTWNNPWESHWTTANNLDAYMENVQHDYMRDYTIYFDIQNISIGVYSVQLTLTRTNYQLISVYLTFNITEVQTTFDSLKVNNVNYITSGVVQINDTTTKKIAWGDFMNLTFDWRTTTAGRQAAIRNSSSTDLNRTILTFIGYDDSEIQWGSHQQEISAGLYSITLGTDLPVAIPADGYNLVFSIQVSKANYETTTFSFNITIRLINTMVKIYTGSVSTGLSMLGSDNVTINVLWGQQLDFYFEFLADEHPGLNDIFALKDHMSIDSIKVNDTASTQNNPWYLPDGTFAGEMDVDRQVPLEGGHYYYHISINTTILNVTTFPLGLPIHFLLNKSYYQDATPTVILKITPWTIQVAYSFGGIEGQYIDKSQHKNFTLTVHLYYEDPNHPGNAAYYHYIEEDWFIVQWAVVKIGSDGTTRVLIGGAGNSGNLTWDPIAKAYIGTVDVTDQMNGVLYIRFFIQSTNGNFKDTTVDQFIVFQNPVETVVIWPLILAAALIGVVSIYTIRKAAQLRIPLVLRLIDETISKIQADKYPAETGVLAGRNEFMVNTLLDRLEQVGIEWEKAEKFTVEETKGIEEKAQPPMSLQEINAALDSIPELTVEEKAIFADELKRLARKEQDEFIASLKHQSS